MVRCGVPGCTNDSNDETCKELTWFKFPLDPELRQAWVKNMGRMERGKSKGYKLFEPRKWDRLCSTHFDKSLFQRDMQAEFMAAGVMAEKPGKRRPRKLVEGAVPTIFAEQSASSSRLSSPPPKSSRESSYLKRKREQEEKEARETLVCNIMSSSQLCFGFV